MMGAPTGFEAQFQQFVYYAGPIIQLLYWAVMIVAALWAVYLFKRWVDFQVGSGEEGAPESSDVESSAGSVDVEEFVD